MSNPYQSVLDAQRARFDSDVTKTLAWRIAQLDRAGPALRSVIGAGV